MTGILLNDWIYMSWQNIFYMKNSEFKLKLGLIIVLIIISTAFDAV